jgi:hypothetical protein
VSSGAITRSMSCVAAADDGRRRRPIELCAHLVPIALSRPDDMDAALASQHTIRAKLPVWSVELEFKLTMVSAARAGAALQWNDLPVLELENALHVTVENFAV